MTETPPTLSDDLRLRFEGPGSFPVPSTGIPGGASDAEADPLSVGGILEQPALGHVDTMDRATLSKPAQGAGSAARPDPAPADDAPAGPAPSGPEMPGSDAVTALPANAAPVRTGAGPLLAATVPEDSERDVATVASLLQGLADPDGDALTLSPAGADGGDTVIAIGDAGGALVARTGPPPAATDPPVTPPGAGNDDGSPAVFYRPVPDFHGCETFEVTVTEGNGGTATGTVEFDVEPVNDRPEAGPVTIGVRPGETRTVTFEDLIALSGARDADGDPLSIVAPPFELTIGAVPGDESVRFVAPASFADPRSGSFAILDGSSSRVVSLTFTPIPNTPPTFAPGRRLRRAGEHAARPVPRFDPRERG